MNQHNDSPFNSIDRIFHEPSRLAIISALGGAIDGLSFNDLRDRCGLTDGNLSRHLKTLEDAGAIRVKKSSLESGRTKTSVVLSDLGRERFVEYLKTLELVLMRASKSLAAEEKAAEFRTLWESQFGIGIFDID